MKKLISMIFLLCSMSLNAADIKFVDTLNTGDPVFLSNDGQNWIQGTFIYFNQLPDCPAETQLDKDGLDYKIYNCDDSAKLSQTVWYNGNIDGVVNHISGRDPARQPVSNQEIYGLLKRFDNILYSNDLGSALGTIKSLYEDRNRLIEVNEVLREKLKQN